eukprot:12894426-Prorocentrum_lima.AAC.1
MLELPLIRAISRSGQVIDMDGSVKGLTLDYYRGTLAHAVAVRRAQLTVGRDGILELDEPD